MFWQIRVWCKHKPLRLDAKPARLLPQITRGGRVAFEEPQGAAVHLAQQPHPNFEYFRHYLVSVVEAAKDKPYFGQHRLTACRLAVRNKPFGVDGQIVFRQVDDLFNIAIFLLRRNYARVGDNIVDILSPHGGRKSEITDLKRRGPVAKNTSPVFAHISIEID